MAEPEPPPVEGFVPLPPADASAEAPKRVGWPKGKPRGPRRNALVRVGQDPSDPDQYVRTEPEPGRCPVCDRAALPLTLDMVRELVQAAQDRLEVLGDRGAEVAVSDVRYLAARLEGLCSLSCWHRRREG